MAGQDKLSRIEDKKVVVHGACRKCNYYVVGEAKIPVLKLANGEIELLHTHFTTVCPMCGSLINLIDASKQPLKVKTGGS